MIHQELSEKEWDSALESHKCLVAWNSQVNDPIVEPGILFDDWVFMFFISFMVDLVLIFLILDMSAGIFYLEW